MDSKFYVTLEVARLLKEKGYDEKRDFLTPVYKENGCLYWSNHEDLSDKIPAITKSEAIDWLESKGIGISIIFCEIEMYEYVVESKDCYYSVVESGYKETRLEAEEAAIIKACELL